MLQAIRDGSKGIVAKIIVGLIILTFALFGIESIVALGGGDSAPAQVNGEEISELQVAQAMQLQKRRLQSQFGENFDPSILNDTLLRKAAVESLINETLLKQAARESGIYFSDKEIDKLIIASPEFQTAGQFDKNQYDLVLRSAGFTRSTHRTLLRSNLSTQQSQAAWQLTAFATGAEVEQVAQLDAQTRNFSFSQFSLADAKKAVAITEEELNQNYKDSADQYMTLESVVVDFIELNRNELKDVAGIDEDELQQRYEAIQEESAAKREYRAAHILLLSADDVARSKIEEALAKIQAGESFAAVAEEYSEDDASKFSGGDLGFASIDVYENEFATALSKLTEKQFSGIVETRDGLHIIKLLETRQPEVAAFSDLKESLVKELKSEQLQALYVERLESLKDEAFSSSDLSVPAKVLGLTVKTSKEFSRNGSAGIAANKTVLAAAFSEMVLYEEANSDVIELDDGRAIVLHLNNFKESKVKPFAQVKNQIESRLRQQKGLDSLSALVQEAIENSATITKWQAFSAKSRNAKGVDSVVLNKAFTMGLTADNKATYQIVDLAAGDKAIVRLDTINRVANVTGNAGSSMQKVSRGKSYNEYKAYYQNFFDESDVIRN